MGKPTFDHHHFERMALWQHEVRVFGLMMINEGIYS
jgi:hypothetical protein